MRILAALLSNSFAPYLGRNLAQFRKPAFCSYFQTKLRLALKRPRNRGVGVRVLKTPRQCQRIVRRQEVSDYGIG